MLIKAFAVAALFPLIAQLSAPDAGHGGLPPDPTNWMSLGWLVAAVFGIVGLANQGLELWGKLFPRQSPPPHETYATKAELKTLEETLNDEIERIDESMEETCGRIEKRFETWLEQMDLKAEKRHSEDSDWKLGVERAIGRVEVKSEFKSGGK